MRDEPRPVPPRLDDRDDTAGAVSRSLGRAAHEAAGLGLVGAPENDAHPDLEVRRVHFDWSGVDVSWLPDDRVAGQVINVIHTALPVGERWFVATYRDALPLVHDEPLRTEMKAFMGQEAVHARSHAGFVAHMADQGYEPEPLEADVEARVAFWEGLGNRFLGERRTLRVRVAVIAGIEHYTAVLGEWALRTDVFDRGDPAVADILRWHGAEELEHKCVAFDVHQAVNGGSYALRALGYLVASIELARYWDRSTAHLVAHDPHLRGIRGWRLRAAMARSARRKNLPSRDLAKAFGAYLRPGFHPAERPTLGLSRTYLAESPAVRRLAS
ncbi:MAG: metal-dependent hydrolase [Acidimicrobiales bacterium]